MLDSVNKRTAQPTDPAEMQPNPVLQVTDLGKRLERRWIWKDIAFELRAGSRLGLVGASGSGKSLLMKALAGLVPVDRGEIRFRGRPLSHWIMPEYRAQVIYSPQRPTLFEGSVEANLKAVLRLSVHQGRIFDREKIVGYLQELGRSADFLDLSATTLSGGEAQILGLLRALQVDPQVLLLDEPTASLDQETAESLEGLVTRWLLAGERRVCIWTSHSPEQISRVSNRQFVLGQNI